MVDVPNSFMRVRISGEFCKYLRYIVWVFFGFVPFWERGVKWIGEQAFNSSSAYAFEAFNSSQKF
jgi:hypothetical protein